MSNPARTIIHYLNILFIELFKASLISYLLLYLIDELWPGFVLNYYNLNIILLVIIISGILALWVKEDKNAKKTYNERIGMIIMVLFSLGAGLLIFFKIKQIGWIAYIISIVGAAMIYLLIQTIQKQIFNDNNKKNSLNKKEQYESPYKK